jgi:hypothetical protein
MAFPTKPQTGAPQQPPEKKPAAPAPAAEAKTKAKPKTKGTSPWSWGPLVRVVLSAAIVFHLVAVFSAPWHIQLIDSVVPMVEPGGEPRDEQGRPLRPEQVTPATYPFQFPLLPRAFNGNAVMRHYANLLYINNGYNFFTPDPGVSHLIRYEVFNDAGEKVAEGQLPDRREQWPRLFYHRHMMLVEQSRDADVGPMRPQGWEYRIAERLMEKHEGTRIRLLMLRHHLLSPLEVAAGQRIEAPATYEEIGVMEHRLPPKAESVAITPGGGG